jgi:molybdopterin converting factor small subunit
MTVRVQFFSHLKDVMKTPALELDIESGATVTDLLAQLFRRTPALRDWDGSLLIAAGVEFVGRDYVLQPSDDIAIMPPVQGG